jgi:hypothetical protein
VTQPGAPAVVVLPDAGPLITLAYADALQLLLAPGWPVRVVDMVLEEVTRNATPTSAKIAHWVAEQGLTIVATRTCAHYRAARSEGGDKRAWSNLGELAIQEAMHTLALTDPDTVAVFLFEDHKIARTTFLVPDNCRKVSTRAWLLFLEGRGWIGSAAEIERAAIAGGRNFSRLRFPP